MLELTLTHKSVYFLNIPVLTSPMEKRKRGGGMTKEQNATTKRRYERLFSFGFPF